MGEWQNALAVGLVTAAAVVLLGVAVSRLVRKRQERELRRVAAFLRRTWLMESYRMAFLAVAYSDYPRAVKSRLLDMLGEAVASLLEDSYAEEMGAVA